MQDVVISLLFICPILMRAIPWVRAGLHVEDACLHFPAQLSSGTLLGRTALHEIALWGNAGLVHQMLQYAQGWKEPWDHRVRQVDFDLEMFLDLFPDVLEQINMIFSYLNSKAYQIFVVVTSATSSFLSTPIRFSFSSGQYRSAASEPAAERPGRQDGPRPCLH